MKISNTQFDGVYLIDPFRMGDQRGEFVKTFHRNTFLDHGIEFRVAEEFMSISHKHVLRGMHFQAPPHEHNKLVYCSSGRILDVLLDLRSESTTFGQVWSVELSDRDRWSIYIPTGLAHGFLALEDNTTVVYRTDTVHHPESDMGIRWDSIPFTWPVKNPVISERDSGFIGLENYNTPF